MEMPTCCYRNVSDRLAVIRSSAESCTKIEQVVFPFDLAIFSCPAEEMLEIWRQGPDGSQCEERITAQELQMEPQESGQAAHPQSEPRPAGGSQRGGSAPSSRTKTARSIA
jgi:hypothetical protein